MEYARIVAALLLCLALASFAYSQDSTSAANDPALVDGVRIIPLAEDHYLLHVEEGNTYNILAVTAPDGVLLVDTGLPNLAERVQHALESITDQPVRIVILTHGHGDHVGGLPVLGPDAVILAHQNALMDVFFSLEALPRIQGNVVLVEDTLEVMFNDERIRIEYVPNAHTTSDLIVHFTDANLVAVGDLAFPFKYPYVDYSYGGVFITYMANILRMADDFDPGATVVCGHGVPCSCEDLVAYHMQLEKNVGLLKLSLDRAETYQQIEKSGILAEWDDYASGFIDQEFWIRQVHLGLGQADQLDLWGEQKPTTIHELATEAFMQTGPDHMERVIRKTFAEENSPIETSSNDLVILGYKLLQREHVEASHRVFRILADEYPDYWNAWDCLGEVELIMGDTTNAVEHYNKSLELNPDNTNAVQVLEGLKTE